jgi:hypothetical protein
LFQDGNHQRKGGYQPQQVDGKDEGFMWSHKMGLQVCLELVHILLKLIPL